MHSCSTQFTPWPNKLAQSESLRVMHVSSAHFAIRHSYFPLVSNSLIDPFTYSPPDLAAHSQFTIQVVVHFALRPSYFALVSNSLIDPSTYSPPERLFTSHFALRISYFFFSSFSSSNCSPVPAGCSPNWPAAPYPNADV